MGINDKFAASKVGSYFKLQERNATLSREILAGTVTFLAMAYIIPVNSGIVSQTGGTCVSDGLSFDSTIPNGGDEWAACVTSIRKNLITATCISSAIACLIMGFAANLPIGLAPGMGINAYFTYTVVGFAGFGPVTYETALGAVFIEGWIFLALSISGWRSAIARAFPVSVKVGMAVGIGLFLTFIGFQGSEGMGFVVFDSATLVHLGGCKTHQRTYTDGGNYSCVPEGANGPNGIMRGMRTWMGWFGFLMIASLSIKNVRGAMLIGILTISGLSWFRNTSFTEFPHTEEGDAAFNYFKKVVSPQGLGPIAGALSFDLGNGDVWIALITFLYTDLLDATGTLYATAKQAGIVERDGHFPGETAAYCADAIGIIVGSTVGCPPITAFVESVAGIEEGGRTGITAIVVGLWFLLSILFNPILASIPPWATGPALVYTGALMMRNCVDIDWDNKLLMAPTFVTIATIPLTYSIAYGLITGLTVAFVLMFIDAVWDVCAKKRTIGDIWLEIKRGPNYIEDEDIVAAKGVEMAEPMEEGKSAEFEKAVAA